MRCFILFFLLLAPSPLRAEDDGCAAAVVEETEGGGVLRKRGEKEPATLQEGDSIEAGDTVETDAKSTVDVMLCDRSLIRIGSNSEFRFESVEGRTGLWRWVWELASGVVRATVQSDPKIEQVKFLIKTPSGSVGVRGTEFVVEETGSESRVYTLEGEVLFGGKSEDFRRPIKELLERVRTVGKDQSSRATRWMQRPAAAQRFDRRQFEQQRSQFFRRPFAPRQRTGQELRERFRKAAEIRRTFTDKAEAAGQNTVREKVRKNATERRQERRMQQNAQQSSNTPQHPGMDQNQKMHQNQMQQVQQLRKQQHQPMQRQQQRQQQHRRQQHQPMQRQQQRQQQLQIPQQSQPVKQQIPQPVKQQLPPLQQLPQSPLGR